MESKYIENTFDDFLKCQYERVSDTHLKSKLYIKPIFLNSVGTVHGGVLSSFADNTMGYTCGFDENNRQIVVTVDLTISFLKGAKGEFLTAEAFLIKKGKTLNHLDCYIYDENNELVARANGIFANRL